MTQPAHTCMDCANWCPKNTPPGMARLGFAACLKRPTPGLTLSAHAPECEKFQPADAKTAQARHAKWSKDKGGRGEDA